MIDIHLEDLPTAFRRFGVKHSFGYALIKSGLMVPQIHVGKSSRIPRHESCALAAARMAGADDDAIRALVIELVAQRGKIFADWRRAALPEAA